MELKLLRYSLCALVLITCVCVIAVARELVFAIRSIDAAAQSASSVLLRIPEQIDITRKQALDAANEHLYRLQELLEIRSDKLQESLDLSLDDLSSLEASVAADLHQVAETTVGLRADLIVPLADFDNLIKEADDLTARINLASKPLLDCQGNGACLPSQILALVGSARYTMGQIAKAAPDTAEAVKQSTKSIAKIADSVSKKQPWYERIFGLARIVSAAKILLF